MVELIACMKPKNTHGKQLILKYSSDNSSSRTLCIGHAKFSISTKSLHVLLSHYTAKFDEIHFQQKILPFNGTPYTCTRQDYSASYSLFTKCNIYEHTHNQNLC